MPPLWDWDFTSAVEAHGTTCLLAHLRLLGTWPVLFCPSPACQYSPSDVQLSAVDRGCFAFIITGEWKPWNEISGNSTSAAFSVLLSGRAASDHQVP